MLLAADHHVINHQNRNGCMPQQEYREALLLFRGANAPVAPIADEDDTARMGTPEPVGSSPRR